MPTIYREYGKTIEITTYSKIPSKVRVYAPRKKRTLYGERRSDSIRRTREICLRRVSSALEEFGCPLFITLTLRGDASDAYSANQGLGRFQVRLRSAFPRCQSIFIPELSPRGRIHFHGLLFNVPLHLGDRRNGGRIDSYGSERKDRTLAKLWGEGFVDVIQTDGSQRLAGYISKYITKSGSHTLFNAMHLLRISQGFPHHFEARDEYAEFFIDQIEDGLMPSFRYSVDHDFLGSIEKRWYHNVVHKPKKSGMLL